MNDQKISNVVTWIFYITALTALPCFTGCSIGGPRARTGVLPTATFGIPFLGIDDLGKHSYGPTLFEKNGIVYTCKGGHIDTYHVRGSADNVRYLIKKVRKTITKKRKGFSFNITGELSTHVIRFEYPESFKKLPKKQREIIAEKIAFQLGPYVGHSATVWHEILTWFGVHFMGFEPEFNSAFSWEDVYSNLLGAELATEVMKNSPKNYNKALTEAIKQEFIRLDIQSAETARQASKKMYGKWYTGNFVPDTKMRNFDIGLDGSVTPTLIPDVAECSSEPEPRPVPQINILDEYGIKMEYRIRPNVFEQGRIFQAAGEKKIYPQKHFPVLIEFMKKAADQKGYKFID